MKTLPQLYDVIHFPNGHTGITVQTPDETSETAGWVMLHTGAPTHVRAQLEECTPDATATAWLHAYAHIRSVSTAAGSSYADDTVKQAFGTRARVPDDVANLITSFVNRVGPRVVKAGCP